MSTVPSNESVGLGLVLTAVQVVVYTAFLLVCCFDVPLLRTEFTAGIPMSFALGLGVIACGVVLTAVYVLSANRSDRSL